MNFNYFNPEDVINNTIIFDKRLSSPEEDILHIAYGIDKNFIYGCGISIVSVLIHNKNDFVFHVFVDTISNSELEKFSTIASMYNTRVEIHIVTCEKLKEFPTTKNWSVAMYFRFIIGDYFINKQDRVLYLDADVVCNGDISELTEIELGNKVIGAVPERDHQWWEQRARNLNCPALEHGYFNSGVMLLNIPVWRDREISSQAIRMLSDHSVTVLLSYMDQDILNIVVNGDVYFLNIKYNTQFSINYVMKKTFVNPVTTDTIFIHYIGPTKPWHYWGNYPVSDSFMVAKKHSPWNADKLLSPVNANNYRYCAKHMFHQNKYIKGIFNYLLYFKCKMGNIF